MIVMSTACGSIAVQDFKPFEIWANHVSSIIGCARRIFLFFATVEPLDHINLDLLSYVTLLTNMNSGPVVTRLIKCSYFKYYNVLWRESKFTLGLNAAKNTYCIKTSFKWKLCGTQFCTKKATSAYVCLPHKQNQGLQRSVDLKSYNIQKQKIRFTLTCH